MRSRRALPLLVALLALVAGLLWLVLQDDGDRESRGRTPRGVFGTTDLGGDPAPGGVPVEPARTSRERVTAEVADATDADPTGSNLVPRSIFRVVVLDAEDRPVPGVSIEVLGEHEPRVTDASGSVVVPRDPPVADLVVLAPAVVGSPIHLRRETTIVRADGVLPVLVEFLDVETGEPVAVRPRGLGGAARAEVRLEPGPARPGHPLVLDLVVDPPDGYAPRPLVVRRRTHVSRRAESVRVRVPIARETSLAARVERADGSPATGATVSVHAGSPTEAWASATADEEGRATLSGLPFVHGASLQLRAGDADGRIAWSAPVVLGTAAAGVEVELVLPAEPGESGAPESDLDTGPRRSDPTVREHGTSRIVLTVLDRDHEPAANVAVSLRGPARRDVRTNEEGRAELIGLPAGRYRATLREPGMTHEVAAISVEKGETKEATLRESPGREATIRVVAPDGRPLPGARVEVLEGSGDRQVVVVGGVQEVDLLTGRDGRCVLRGLGDGPVEVIVSRGPLTTRASLADGLEIVLGR